MIRALFSRPRSLRVWAFQLVLAVAAIGAFLAMKFVGVQAAFVTFILATATSVSHLASLLIERHSEKEKTE